MKIIECVPNFSEGRDITLIKEITDVMDSVSGITLLDVDPGADTNRTVVTIVGDPESIIRSAFLGIKKASELIDMRKHRGAHARMGATDVCPFVPISEAKSVLRYSLTKPVSPIIYTESESIKGLKTRISQENLPESTTH